MTSESKILTVSYGTFSCTLEGFDDPFNTMKAIAEYFRDLTAEDRYFGAEPPQPDAAMLHRIAEREVARLVDARVRENGVHLRPQDGAAADAAAKPHAPMPAAEVAPTPAPVEPSLQDVMPEGVSAKLARVRRSVSTPIFPEAADNEPDAPTPVAPTLDVGMGSAALADLAADTFEVEAVEDTAQDTAGFAAQNLSSDDLAEKDLVDLDLANQDIADQDLTDPNLTDLELADLQLADPDPDNFSSDALSQLEALLRAPTDDLAEDETPAAFLAGDATDVGIDDADWADAPAPMADYSAVLAEDVDAADSLADDAFLVDATTETAAELDEALLDLAADSAPQPDVTLADLQPEDAPDLPASLTEALRDDPLPEAAAPTEDALDDLVASAAPQPAETARPTGRGKRVNSRVVRLHRSDDDDAPQARADRPISRRLSPGSDDAEVTRLMRQTDDEMADDDNRRRLDSIAQLKAAVVATEADRALGGDLEKPADTRSDTYRDDLAQVVQPDDEAAASVDAAPVEPEVKPRRKTVSVRPQEPRPGTIRPGMMGPPPLVLVSEQRIDRLPAFQTPTPVPAAPPAPAAATAVPDLPTPTAPRDALPVAGLRTGRLTGAIGIGAASPLAPQKKIVLDQPSQGAATDLDDEEDHDEDLTANEQAGLAEFAERVGVKSMAEMLEAAAAYATCIEKRSQFTRPQLMRRLMASAGSRQVSREDGLRSFGTLLRTGRIEKVSRGHYMLAESSPYLAEARRLS